MQNEIDCYTLEINWEKLAQDYVKSWQSQRVSEKRVFYKTSPSGYPTIPNSISIRDYQQNAILSWFQNKGRGTLKMATGSGKTITALAITTELYQKIGLQVLLVICPYKHLVTQWAQECVIFNLRPILAMMSVYNWQSQLSNELYNLSSGHHSFLTVITTNSTFISEGFQTQLKFFPIKTLIIGDEAHNLGTPRLEECLPRKIGLRLALSATPERYFDEEGTDVVLNYFGDILQPEFTLADAIQKGALVPYNYYPIFVELTESEALHYAKLTQRIGWALTKNDRLNGNDTLTSLLMQRSRLVGAANNKLNALRTLMQNRLCTHHTLFYCGDGSVDQSTSAHRRQLEAVTHLLGRQLGYRVNTYTAETPITEREQLKQQFESGELQGLVAIRCLDEGIDIPSIQTAVILASTANPRQFIQRRGRILRPHPGKTQANLFDMIVLPPKLDRETWEVERNLLRKELKRFVEFAQLALNADEATQQFLTLQQQYCL
ncbi:DNA phosphorothioation system restriction enzyme [Aphanothece hegewaldii CCALA 016]|uniref:DNA phosphorothioation system restriction enzyme n=1 Tax=Aphanothece hegewaldii CCALA 016 TaxID=2107694 RepID=A0A2T1LUK0_9CHRO|nr:DNA phosphorothioation system restriction enzyme [Aphanothece hegewaldii]PSF35216.1 DNA phosphorothioation system restriction enzyme [Aphanothece hegewaldii CCALA 016]